MAGKNAFGGATLNPMNELPSASPSPLGAWQRHHPRRFEDFTYAYAVISRRSGGVSIGVNLNLDKICNFDCPYCQVDRKIPGPLQNIEVAALIEEVEALVNTCQPDGICQLPRFDGVATTHKHLRDIALSGDGEPTMVPQFENVCLALSAFQVRRADRPVKLVLITNGTLLDRENVLRGIDALLQTSGDVWAKLDAGTQEYFERVNVSRVSLDRIEANLKRLGERHPYTIQSFFGRWNGEAPTEVEITAYVNRLKRLKEAGSRIHQVQLYSLARPPAASTCSPLESEKLQAIADRIHELGISAQVYATAD
jgi:wyosine [tRNA(Phe)-imidazoG37] synthetase (radical SAM superfamily)